MSEQMHTPEAEALADAILKASGSALRYHTMPSGRTAIFAAAQKGIDAARADLLAMLDRVSHLNGFRELNDILPEVRAALAKARGE